MENILNGDFKGPFTLYAIKFSRSFTVILYYSIGSKDDIRSYRRIGKKTRKL